MPVKKYTPPTTHECPQKKSAQSVQPFRLLYATYIWMSIVLLYTNRRARRCPWKFLKKKYLKNIPWPLMSVHKNFEPNRSSRLAGYTQHKYECLVSLYKNRRYVFIFYRKYLNHTQTSLSIRICQWTFHIDYWELNYKHSLRFCVLDKMR